MLTQQAQIKINLPLQLKEYIESKAATYGLPLAGYIKYLMVKDVEDMVYPVYSAPNRVEKKARKALREKSKAVDVDDMRAFLKGL